MDLYRLSGQEKDLMPLNLEHVFATDICLIEWPQRLGNMVPLHRLEINLRIVVVGEEEQQQQQQQQSSDSKLDDDECQPRQVTLTPFGKDWEDRLEMLRTEGYVDDWIINTK
jgi:tRNA A37 threonylcarbamoyladenosine biosynthesis protein TsaE